MQARRSLQSNDAAPGATNRSPSISVALRIAPTLYSHPLLKCAPLDPRLLVHLYKLYICRDESRGLSCRVSTRSLGHLGCCSYIRRPPPHPQSRPSHPSRPPFFSPSTLSCFVLLTRLSSSGSRLQPPSRSSSASRRP